jgi:hypothetical protein
MEFTERMERGRDAAAALRHRGIMTGKCAAGWNKKKRHVDEGTWHAVYADARKRWQYAKTDSHSLYERMVFPERDFDPFDPHARELTMDDVIAAIAERERADLLATF